MVVSRMSSDYASYNKPTPTKSYPKMKRGQSGTNGVRSFMDAVVSPFVRCVAPNFEHGCAPVCTSVPEHFRADPAVVSPMTDRRYPPSQPTSPRQGAGRGYETPQKSSSAPMSPPRLSRDFSDLDSAAIAATAASSSSSSAPEDKDIVTPRSNDVLCGRGGSSNRHLGNIHFRELVAANKQTYVGLTKKQKMLIARKVVDTVRNTSPPGRFLARDLDTGLWYDIGIPRSLEKTSQALREKNSNDATHVADNEAVEVTSGGSVHIDGGGTSRQAASPPTVQDEPTTRSRGKKIVEAPPLVIPAHLAKVYRPAKRAPDSERPKKRPSFNQATNESIERVYSESQFRYHPSSPTAERYAMSPQMLSAPRSSAYYGSETPSYHGYATGIPPRPSQSDHRDQPFDPYNHYSAEHYDYYSNSSAGMQQPHSLPHHHARSVDYRRAHPPSPPSRHAAHQAQFGSRVPVSPSQPHLMHANPRTHSHGNPAHLHAHSPSYHRRHGPPPPVPHSRYRPHRAPMHPHQHAPTSPRGSHSPRTPASTPSPSKYANATVGRYPPSPTSPPSFSHYDYEHRPEHYIPRPEAPVSTNGLESGIGETVYRSNGSSGYVRSKGEVSPERRQEWKRQRDEGIVRKLSDASLSRAVESSLTLDERNRTQPSPRTAMAEATGSPSATPVSPTATPSAVAPAALPAPASASAEKDGEKKLETTAPDLKSPSGVLHGRSRHELPSQEMAAAKALSGLAALSTAAFLKLDEKP